MLETQKSDYTVLTIPAAVRGTVEVDEEALSLAKRRLDDGEEKPQHAQGAAEVATRSN
jgi:hypothetical protein